MQNSVDDMSRGPFIFLWGRPAGGEIQLVRNMDSDAILAGTDGYGLDGSGEVLTDPVPNEHTAGPWLTAQATPWSRYPPLTIPDLHRRFARVKPNERNILRAASRYGLLGHSPYIMRKMGGWGPDPVNRFESIWSWEVEIAKMSRLVKIWDLILRKDSGKLGQWVKWTTLSDPNEGWTRQRVKWSDLGWAPDSSSTDQPEARHGTEAKTLALKGQPDRPIPQSWNFGDPVAPAYYYLCGKINDRLERHVDPVIMPFDHGDIMLWPDCLLSAMYVLFALEVSGKSRPAIICRGCERYFVPIHGSQRYCEDRCRKRRWWRNRLTKDDEVEHEDE